MSYKTTKKDFKLFKELCEFWVDRLGLGDWDVEYIHTNLNKGDLSECSWDVTARWANIIFSKKFGKTKPTKREIHSCAFHEAVELLLAELFTLAQVRYINFEQLERSRHAIVQRLSNCFLDTGEK